MSGVKCSSWHYEQQRAVAEEARRKRLEEEARRAEAARREAAFRALEEATLREVRENVAEHAHELSDLIAQVTAVIGGIDTATRRGFRSELSDIDLQVKAMAIDLAEAHRLSTLSGASLVREGVTKRTPAISRLSDDVVRVRQFLAQVEEIRFSLGPKRMQELAALSSSAASMIARSSAFDQAAAERSTWKSRLDGLRHKIFSGEFDAAEAGLGELASQVSDWVARASTAQEQTRERRQVLDALRDTCRHFGFRELNPNQLEEQMRDPSGPWTLVVDTRLNGKISFTVTEDSIRAESGMSVQNGVPVDDFCFTQFVKIEEEMASAHGVHTYFTSDQIVRPPDSTAGEARRQSTSIRASKRAT